MVSGARAVDTPARDSRQFPTSTGAESSVKVADRYSDRRELISQLHVY